MFTKIEDIIRVKNSSCLAFIILMIVVIIGSGVGGLLGYVGSSTLRMIFYTYYNSGTGYIKIFFFMSKVGIFLDILFRTINASLTIGLMVIIPMINKKSADDELLTLEEPPQYPYPSIVPRHPLLR